MSRFSDFVPKNGICPENLITSRFIVLVYISLVESIPRVNFLRLIVVTTDAASNMKSICNLLKQEYAKLYHVTCIAHALHKNLEGP